MPSRAMLSRDWDTVVFWLGAAMIFGAALRLAV